MLSQNKKRKPTVEENSSIFRVFNEKWTDEYVCIEVKNSTLCLICKETISVFKDYNQSGHYL